MTPAGSLFLDIARFIAALVVALGHLTSQELNSVYPWVRWSHEAVVVFFVISGYVIAYVGDTREKVIADFAAARLGRLYSLVVPALLLTLVVDTIGMAANPAIYVATDQQNPLLRIIANLLFIQQAWNFTVTPMSNGPFWSLSYEFWYYVAFGLFMFAKGKLRYVLCAAALLCAGPRIAAFFPLWLLGVLAYHASVKAPPGESVKIRGRWASSLAFLLLVWLGNPLDAVTNAIDDRFPDKMLHIGGMQLFLGYIPRLAADTLVGIIFAAMIYFSHGQLARGSMMERASGAIRYLAGSTFTLYVFHMPLMSMFVAVFGVPKDSALGLALVGVLVGVCCLALSHLFERRAAQFRLFFLQLFKLAGRGWSRLSASQR